MRVTLLVLLVVGCVAQSSARAQDGASGAAASGGQDSVSPAARRQVRRWAITVDIGDTSSGPAREIEEAMRAAHLDDTSPGFGSSVGHPFSNTSFAAIGFPVLVEARYLVRQPWSVGVLFSDTPIGSTSGYHDPFQYVSVDYSVTSVAAMLSAGPRFFQVGLGPALHVARARHGDSSGQPPPPWSNHSKLGFIGQARVAVPAGSRAFLDLTLQYRFVGRVVVGPYASSGGAGLPVMFPPTGVQYNHWFVGLGSGLRF